MKLQELVGKKAVRTKPAHRINDDSYTRSEYITVVEVTNESIKYIQHFASPHCQGEREFMFDSSYDQHFLDDNWKEYKEEA